jgi:Glycogen recognition site of AMP-activated protein kinase
MKDIHDISNEMDDELDAFAKRAAAPLRSPVVTSSDFERRAMSAIRAESQPQTTFGFWLIRPRDIRITPLRMLAMAASLVIVASVGTAGFIHGRELAVANAQPATGAVALAPPAAAPAETVHVVRFQLAAPGAHRVALVGDFNDWSRDAIVLQPAEKPGVWTASVSIKPGRHEYAFIVDGKRWVPDPYALTHTDEYNVQSSVIQVSSAGTE